MGRRGWMGVDGGPIGGSISPPPSAFSRGAHRPHRAPAHLIATLAMQRPRWPRDRPGASDAPRRPERRRRADENNAGPARRRARGGSDGDAPEPDHEDGGSSPTGSTTSGYGRVASAGGVAAPPRRPAGRSDGDAAAAAADDADDDDAYERSAQEEWKDVLFFPNSRKYGADMEARWWGISFEQDKKGWQVPAR